MAAYEDTAYVTSGVGVYHAVTTGSVDMGHSVGNMREYYVERDGLSTWNCTMSPYNLIGKSALHKGGPVESYPV